MKFLMSYPLRTLFRRQESRGQQPAFDGMTGWLSTWKAYYELCKPRVVALMLLTAIVGMCLASPGFVPANILIWGTLGIAFAAGAAATINHVIDSKIDKIMNRTKARPIPTGKVNPMQACIFAACLAFIGMVILVKFINPLTAVITFLTLVGYAVIYTLFLKRATPQNIVIGGAAGAAPPLLGWIAVTGQVDPEALLLMLIIFVWTPPHFWALAIYRYEEYAKVNIPMLPVTHGIPFTKLCILLYTLLLFAVVLLPFAIGMSGWIYLISATILTAGFVYSAIELKVTDKKSAALKTFRYSIVHLMLLFVALLVDHYYYLAQGI